MHPPLTLCLFVLSDVTPVFLLRPLSAPVFNYVIKEDHVELQLSGRNSSLLSACVQYERNGMCQVVVCLFVVCVCCSGGLLHVLCSMSPPEVGRDDHPAVLCDPLHLPPGTFAIHSPTPSPTPHVNSSQVLWCL